MSAAVVALLLLRNVHLYVTHPNIHVLTSLSILYSALSSLLYHLLSLMATAALTHGLLSAVMNKCNAASSNLFLPGRVGQIWPSPSCSSGLQELSMPLHPDLNFVECRSSLVALALRSEICGMSVPAPVSLQQPQAPRCIVLPLYT